MERHNLQWEQFACLVECEGIRLLSAITSRKTAGEKKTDWLMEEFAHEYSSYLKISVYIVDQQFEASKQRHRRCRVI